MSVSVVREKGLTVITVASDNDSVLPPLCQILKSLCYSRTCCSVKKGLLQTSSVSVLGAIMIMVGLFNIGLGPGRISLHPEDLPRLGVPYWLGGVCILTGVVTVLAGRFPALLLVGIAVFVNIICTIVSVVGIVMYAIDLGDNSVDRMCDRKIDGQFDDCHFLVYFSERLLTTIDITMIIMAVLQLCVCFSFAVIGTKALLNGKKGEDDRDVEIYQPLMTKDLISPGA